MNWFKKLLPQRPASQTVHQDDRDPKQSNAYDMIGGDNTLKAIAHSFYQRMLQGDDTRELLAVHRAPLAQSEQKLYEFLSGWLGGPQLFQQKYGHPALRARHMPFAIDEQLRDQWLICMRYALEQHITNPDHRQVIYRAIATLADHMRNQ
ncbi:group II truncated hemoglobin [Shewanella sedimentimangrovi]|uniref:Group II truncated hemoglobin n=1 Tax=Shewanella sedimentimangrovi TaxID=2814293 RepID=A0ABX7R0J8_9GAMM|nr:group II truncated hemoglobin [Shewanella sedimentimangrovi]QSX37319.1 group II truncated hemoglobin [Shewanella sedimentimangrovi]